MIPPDYEIPEEQKEEYEKIREARKLRDLIRDDSFEPTKSALFRALDDVLKAHDFEMDRNVKLIKLLRETRRELDNWQADAQQALLNADFWRKKSESAG
jgi:hypothetical protein